MKKPVKNTFILKLLLFLIIFFAKQYITNYRKKSNHHKRLQSYVKTKNAIVIGATSGIGMSIVKVFLRNNYTVGAAGIKMNLLSDLKEKHGNKIFIRKIPAITGRTYLKYCEELLYQINAAESIMISFKNKIFIQEIDEKKTMATLKILKELKSEMSEIKNFSIVVVNPKTIRVIKPEYEL